MDPMFHLLIPVFILLLIGVDKKFIFLLSPIAILPDLDFFYIHRALFHNIFFGFLVILIIYAIFKKVMSNVDVNTDENTKENENKNNNKINKRLFFGISSFYFLSHILLDYAGVALLWPLSKVYYAFDFSNFSFFTLNALPSFVPSPDYLLSQTTIILVAFAVMLYEIKKEIKI